MTTERGNILRDACAATEGDRNGMYGDPTKQLGLAGRLKRMMRGSAEREIGPAEMEALDMVLIKISRAVVGASPGRDTYVDGAAYFAIAGECAAAWEADRATVEAESGGTMGGLRDRAVDSLNFAGPALAELDLGNGFARHPAAE